MISVAEQLKQTEQVIVIETKQRIASRRAKISITTNFIAPFLANCMLFFFLVLLQQILLLSWFFSTLELAVSTFLLLFVVLVVLSFVIPPEDSFKEKPDGK